MHKSYSHDAVKQKTVLFVNSGIKNHEKHMKQWALYNINLFRVNSMQEALKRLLTKESYYFVLINENKIDYFFDLLKYMRDATDIPIFIYTANFSMKKKIEALRLGADLYNPLPVKIDDTIKEVLLNLKLHDKWSNRLYEPLPIIIGGDVILSPSRSDVYVNGKKVETTRKEFDVLKLLIENKSQYVKPCYILDKIWNEENDDDHRNALWITIFKLRKKLAQASPRKEYIKTRKYDGYIFDEA